MPPAASTISPRSVTAVIFCFTVYRIFIGNKGAQAIMGWFYYFTVPLKHQTSV